MEKQYKTKKQDAPTPASRGHFKERGHAVRNMETHNTGRRKKTNKRKRVRHGSGQRLAGGALLMPCAPLGVLTTDDECSNEKKDERETMDI